MKRTKGFETVYFLSASQQFGRAAHALRSFRFFACFKTIQAQPRGAGVVVCDICGLAALCVLQCMAGKPYAGRPDHHAALCVFRPVTGMPYDGKPGHRVAWCFMELCPRLIVFRVVYYTGVWHHIDSVFM